MKPRIALNGRFSGTQQPTGTQTAAFHLLDAIVQANQEYELVAFVDTRFNGIAPWASSDLVKVVEIPFQDWSRSKAQLWEQFALPRLSKAHGCNLIHHPMTTAAAWKNGMASLVTVCDINFLLHPEWFSRAFRMAYRFVAIPGIERADRVVAISAYVRDQVGQHLKVPANRLHMTYLGTKRLQSACVSDAQRPYILCVGSLQPHKNLARVIQAFQVLREEMPDVELRVVGRPQAQFSSIPELPSLLNSPGVRLLGYLSDSELADAYAGARAFCYPSLEEGFGLPVIEAMSVGTPVLTSNVSCLPEIAGPHALSVDPYSVEVISNGLRKLIQLSGAERAALAQSGREWAARFSWANAGKAYLDHYRQLVH